MCSQYTLHIATDDLRSLFPGSIRDDLAFIETRLLPSHLAPVLVKDPSGLIKMTAMKFSLVPSWSKEPKVKFATHNARIETVHEKPTWKIPFLRQHCIVPMTGFFESVYVGPEAGHIIEFHQPDKKLILAAGLFDFWKDKDHPENSFFSFSVLTTEPNEFILNHGHDRCPIFLDADAAKKWLELNSNEARSLQDFLLQNHHVPKFEVDILRPLKPGWERKAQSADQGKSPV